MAIATMAAAKVDRKVSLSGSRFRPPELQLLIHVDIHLDKDRGGFFIPCLSRVPGPKDACSHSLEIGEVDSRPGPSGRQPTPITFLAAMPHLPMQAPGEQGCNNSRSDLEHLMQRVAGGPWTFIASHTHIFAHPRPMW